MHRIIRFAIVPTLAIGIAFVFTSIGTANEHVSVGSPAPQFELADQNGELHSLEDYQGQWVILYFYPKDETPGCTTEACEFRDNIFAFHELGARVLGVSLDNVASHKAFAEEHGLPFSLLADTAGDVAAAYGVKTRMFGMTVAKRQTFIVDPDGNIVKHYEKVKPEEHTNQVLADLRKLLVGPEQAGLQE